MSYYLAHFVSWLCCRLPGGFCEWLGRVFGRLTWPLVPGKRRRMAKENICRCLGVDEAAADRIARASWIRFGPMLFEVLRFPVIKEQMAQYALQRYGNGDQARNIVDSTSWEAFGYK